MGRLKFDKIPRSFGRYSEFGNILTIQVPERHREDLMSRLTLTNKSNGFRMRQIMNSIAAIKSYGGSEEKINELLLEYRELQETQERKYYEIDEAGNFLVCPGLWYLCDAIEGDRHLNTEVSYTWKDPRARHYQDESCFELMKYKRATAVLATGLGKSIIILTVVKNFVLAGKRVCVVVPTEELVKQMSLTIGALVEKTTGAGGGRTPKPGHDVLVTTAASAIKYIDNYDCIIIDESHHASAKTWENLLLAGIKAEYTYNLTATPERTDGMDLGIHAFGGPIVYERDAEWGVANSWLCALDVYFCNIVPKDGNGDPIEIPITKPAAVAYKIMVSRPEVNSFLLTNVLKAVKQGKKVMVLYKTVKAGESLKKLLLKNGVNCGLATSKSKGVIAQFRKSEIQVMISNDRLVGEGVDIPDADFMFNVIQNSSETTTSQVTGRILRPSPGKTKGVMVDVCIHGYGQFENAGKKRLKVYKKITDNITIVGEMKK